MPQAIPPQYLPLPLGQIRPEGWMLAQMTRDLTSGFAGCLDELAPHAFKDVFGVERKHGGLERAGGKGEDPKRWWWHGETQAVWLDGLIRASFLSDHEPAKAKAGRIVAHVLKHQERDGYLGVYAKKIRFRCDGEDGELWTQSRIMVALLAYHELTGAAEPLQAVCRGADLAIKHYGPNRSYFHDRRPAGGIGHGLMFEDAMEWLHNITGDPRYVRFGEFLYNDYSTAETVRDKDHQIDSLLSDKPLVGHTPHVTEHLRTHLWLHYATGKEIYKHCYEAAFAKARLHMVPSGCVIGSESVNARLPTGNMPYEYCSITELMTSLHSLVRKSGDLGMADWAENVVFNAGQGARLPDGGGISYLSTDNRREARASFHGRRGKYSPTHEDVAVCCNPNAVKLLPYHVGQMWLRLNGADPGLAAMYYGPCRVNTEIAGTPVTIHQRTHYPFDETIEFEIQPVAPVEFTLRFRIPGWAGKAVLTIDDTSVVQTQGWITIRRIWRADDQVTLAFTAPVQARKVCDSETFLTRGPLIYAAGISHRKMSTRKYAGGLADFDILPRNAQAAQPWDLYLPAPLNTAGFTVERRPVDMDFPWDDPPLTLRGELLDAKGKRCAATLTPMGCTILRRVTFPFLD